MKLNLIDELFSLWPIARHKNFNKPIIALGIFEVVLNQGGKTPTRVATIVYKEAILMKKNTDLFIVDINTFSTRKWKSCKTYKHMRYENLIQHAKIKKSCNNNLKLSGGGAK